MQSTQAMQENLPPPEILVTKLHLVTSESGEVVLRRL